MIIALAGNPNSGKTTLFNALTGSNQYVGNWAGVTVEKKEGTLKKHPDVMIQDLPGIYSLSPYSPEELIAREWLVSEKPDAIINIIDASSLERNLYLTSQLAELQIPMAAALNMMDLVEAVGDTIDDKELSKRLGCPVVRMKASSGQGCLEAAQTALQQAKEKKLPNPAVFDGKLEEMLAALSKQLPEESRNRYLTVKAFEKDDEALKAFKLSEADRQKIEEIRHRAEQSFDDDAQSIIADQRYQWISRILDGIHHKKMTHTLSVSDRIDLIMTNRFLALPIFAAVMGLVYWLALSTAGSWMTDWVNDVFVAEWCQGTMRTFLESIHASDWIVSLVTDGIIGGIGAPLGFIPQMAVVFLCLSFLEDCGYMARIAFIMDRLFRKMGLSGKSFISFMVSSGCGIPGILAARTIEEERDRRMTMIVTTSMPCGAKLPVIALIAGALMGSSDAWWIAWAAYLGGIAAIIVSALILKHMKRFAGQAAPFIMELPAYHWPKPANVLRQTGLRCWHFIRKAGTVIFACCVITWFLASFGFGQDGFGLVDAPDSLLAAIGNGLAILFAPLGWGNWQAAAASLSGFIAKENIVSTMGILTDVLDETGEDPALWAAVMSMFANGMAAFSFLLFNMLDAPCLAAISTMVREMNDRKWAAFALAWQMFYAYSISLIVYQLGCWIVYGTFGFWTAAALLLLAWYCWMIFKPVPEQKQVLSTQAV